MDITNDHDSWISRNGWVTPLIGSAILILAPLLTSSLLASSGVVIPAGFNVLIDVVACFGLFFGALKARLTDTLSAQIFCYVISLVLSVVAVWQIIEILKH